MKIKLLSLLFSALFLASCSVKLPATFNEKSLEEKSNFKIITDQSHDSIPVNRYISIKKTTNFRDIGGLKTTENKTVKWNLIYRSDNLSQLKKNEFEKFDALQIKTVIDLRTEAEIAQKEDNLPENTEYLPMPILNDQGDLMAQMKGKVLRGEIKEAQSKALMEEFYKKCVTENIPLLKEIILKVSTSDSPILYHCSAGKDRTGIVTALLLSILKVDRETIMNEYLLSNYYRNAKVKSTIQKAKLLKVLRPKLNTTVILNFMAVDSDYLNAIFNTIDQKYGGMDSFISNELGIDNSLRRKIIERLTY